MKSVLLINDSRFESMILAEILSKLNYDVEMTDEFNALIEVESYEPDIVIANYIMEEIRGDKLIQMIKVGHPEIICIMSSSNPLNKDEFKLCGVDGILRTPVSKFILQELLRRVNEEQIEASQVRRCDQCNADMSSFSEHILFCPFCGEEMISND